MKIGYDQHRDLLYLRMSARREKAARTETLAPGVHARDELIGIEVLDTAQQFGGTVQVEVALQPA
jgi:hypothetical protein